MHSSSLRAVARLSALAAGAALAATLHAGAPASAMPVEAGSAGATKPAPATVAARAGAADASGVANAAVEREPRRTPLGEQVVALASHEAGDPYVYAAAGPDSFDCSGFTQYVFAQVGVSLPHSSSAQAGMVESVSDPLPGDLVFFTGSGGVYHVGIYAGDGQIWHSPRSGDVVSLDPIWSSSVFYGRVL